jgi:hypothetical protein
LLSRRVRHNVSGVESVTPYPNGTNTTKNIGTPSRFHINDISDLEGGLAQSNGHSSSPLVTSRGSERNVVIVLGVEVVEASVTIKQCVTSTGQENHINGLFVKSG